MKPAARTAANYRICRDVRETPPSVLARQCYRLLREQAFRGGQFPVLKLIEQDARQILGRLVVDSLDVEILSRAV